MGSKRNTVITLATGAQTLWSSTAFAQANSLQSLLPTQDIANNTIMIPVFMGAFGFAMWSATWLIRERRNLDQSHRSLALEHADLKARHERAQALLDIPDQRIIIWTGDNEAPTCRGTLPLNVGAPEDVNSFTAFSSWVAPQSSRAFETAVSNLRAQAESFDLTISSQNGSMIEVQGRTSGSHAFVRFIGLSGDRAALASLKVEHAQLSHTTQTMKALLEAVPFPVWMGDGQDKLEWVNQAYIKAVDGKSMDSVKNHKAHLLDKNDRQKVAQSHEKALQRGEVSMFRNRLPATLSGNRQVIDFSEVCFPGGMAGMAVDMSEVEEVQSQLRRTVEGHAQTMNQLATAVAIFDEKRRLIFYNQAFENLWKLDPKLLQGEPDNGLLFDTLRHERKIADQPDWSKWRNTLLQVYEQTQPHEDWWHLPDARTLRVVANPHRQGGVTWVFENITEQLEMESRYIALTQVQGETLDHLVEAIAVFAPDGRLKLSNPSFQSVWALTDEQVAADTAMSAIASHCKTLTKESEVWEEFSTGVTGVSDLRQGRSGRLTASSGSVMDYAFVPLPNGQTMLSFADVSASVHLEQTLVERNEALEAAEKLKNAFIEHVSYEFRAPLTNIKGFAEVLEQQAFGELNKKQNEYVGHISSSASVLHSLVDNLLDLATVDAGVMELDLQSLELQKVTIFAARSVADQLKERGVQLTLRMAKETGLESRFVADATRVQQVLFNLLSNAIRFSSEGSSVILKSTVETDDIVFTVSDNGPGIPESERDNIFERFESRVQGGGRGGAGLGLSISRSLVELHGGTVELDKKFKGGTSFICRLPKLPKADGTPVAEAAE